MQPIPSPLLVLHEDGVLLNRLGTLASQRGYDLRTASDWDTLITAARSAPASALIVA